MSYLGPLLHLKFQGDKSPASQSYTGISSHSNPDLLYTIGYQGPSPSLSKIHEYPDSLFNHWNSK